jgi:hypothetical protein
LDEPARKKRKLQHEDKASHQRETNQEVVEAKVLDLADDLRDKPVSDEESLSDSMGDVEAGDPGEGYDGNRLFVAVTSAV